MHTHTHMHTRMHTHTHTHRDGGVSEDLVPISALHGVGLEELLAKLECAVIERTQRAFWNILLPTYGPELRLAVRLVSSYIL